MYFWQLELNGIAYIFFEINVFINFYRIKKCVNDSMSQNIVSTLQATLIFDAKRVLIM